MATTQVLFGFHAVGVRVRSAPQTVQEVYVAASRRDARMTRFLAQARDAGVRLIASEPDRLEHLAGTRGHQGVVALVKEMQKEATLDGLLDKLTSVPLLLVLDGVTDPHNLGASLRVADGAGAQAVISPKDRAAGLTSVAAKAASGAAETVPYFPITNLARTLRELQDRSIWVVGTSDDASHTLYECDLTGPIALVLGAEGGGMRALTRKTCDELVRIPMCGAVESLNVSVAAGVCLYEARRQRTEKERAQAIATGVS